MIATEKRGRVFGRGTASKEDPNFRPLEVPQIHESLCNHVAYMAVVKTGLVPKRTPTTKETLVSDDSPVQTNQKWFPPCFSGAAISGFRNHPQYDVKCQPLMSCMM